MGYVAPAREDVGQWQPIAISIFNWWGAKYLQISYSALNFVVLQDTRSQKSSYIWYKIEHKFL